MCPVPVPDGGGAGDEKVSGRFPEQNTGRPQKLPAGSLHSGLWHAGRGKLRLCDGEDEECGRGPVQV